MQTYTLGDARTSIPDLPGEPYTTVLERFHRLLRPRTYFEIGTESGGSLALARCRSVAVDPQFGITADIIGQKPQCCLYQMPSDAFFAEHDPRAILGGPIDLAFLDGMHLAEFLLRDFANTERHCRPNSVIALHDCVPVDVHMTARDEADYKARRLGTRPDWWTGDVWKVVLALKRHRPDLAIHALDAAWTGLILITRLDPRSTVLDDRYADIAGEFAGAELREHGIDRYVAELDLQSTRSFARFEDLSSRFWF